MIYLDTSLNVPLYEQIYKQLKDNIICGNLAFGSKLSSTREASKTLSVSRNTIEHAYSKLCAEGYIINKPGKGFFVENCFDNDIKNNIEIDNNFSNVNDITNYKYDLNNANVINKNFPINLWRRYINEALSTYHIENLNIRYSSNMDEEELKKEILNYLRRNKSIQCDINQIVLCSNKADAIEKISKLFDFNTRHLAIEEPGSFVVRNVFENNNYTIETIPHIDVSTIEKSKAKLIYTTTLSQYLIGSPIPIETKLKLLDLAKRNDFFIIEDDYNYELINNSRPIQTLYSLKSDRVIYLQTFSEILLPGIHMCFFILPISFMRTFSHKFKYYYSPLSWLEQKTLALYMKNGNLEKLIRSHIFLREKYLIK